MYTNHAEIKKKKLDSANSTGDDDSDGCIYVISDRRDRWWRKSEVLPGPEWTTMPVRSNTSCDSGRKRLAGGNSQGRRGELRGAENAERT